MGKLVSYMFTSLDGHIADTDGGLGWVPIDDELMRFANAYFAAHDGIVFGRTAWEGFVSYWDELDPTDPAVGELEIEFAGIFREMTRIVVSRSLAVEAARTVVVGDDVLGRLAELKQQPDRDLLLICGPELRSMLTGASLVDRFRVLVAPVVLGRGRPQFADPRDPLRLRLTGARTFDAGVAMLDYEPIDA